MADFQVFVHPHLIGFPDASIAVLEVQVQWSRVATSNFEGVRGLEKLGRNAALLVVDMQLGFDDPCWGARNNPLLETNVMSLIAAWRAADAPLIHVHHDSPSPKGLLRTNAVKPQACPLDGEPIYRKRVNSAFIGTSLEADLRRAGIATLVIVGLTTNHCISTTARMAGNLGFATFVVSDATATFDRVHLDGRMRLAEDVHNAALSDLQHEFARIVDTDSVLAALTTRRYAHV